MRRAIFVFFCLVLAMSMAAIPADAISAKSASSLELSAPSPAQQEDEKELIDDILDELKRARGFTDDKEIRGQIDDVRSMVKAAWKYERAGDSELALAMKYRIAKHLEQLISQLPAVSPGMTTAAAAIPEENPLYEELLRVRAKIDRLIDMELERVPEGVTPVIPEIQRVTEPEIKRPPEMERLIVYSAKFLCGPAFGGEGVQPGSYSTAINVHNPQDQTVYLFKKAVIAEPEYRPRGQISAFRKVRLAPDEAIEIDCLDIGSLLRPQPEPERPSIIPLRPGEVEVQCPTTDECECMTRAEAEERGYTSLCQQEPCDKDTSGQLMYCFRKPAEEPECPTGCECMTRAEAEERGYTSWCQNQTTPCGTDTAGIQKYCFEKPAEEPKCPTGCECMDPAEADELGYEWCLRNGDEIPCATDAAGIQRYCHRKPAGKSGLSRIASAMPEETGLTAPPEQTGTIVQTTTVSPVSSLIRFVKGFVVIYSTAPLDVVGVYTASTQFGFSLDVEYLQPSSRGVRPIRIPEEEPEEPPPTEAECPPRCDCVPERDIAKYDLALCDGRKIVCGPNHLCAQDKEEAECPDPCRCMTEQEGYQGGYVRCQGTDMECAWDQNQRPIKFCFQPPEAPPPTEAKCPNPCRCMTEQEGYQGGYVRCQGTDIECAWDQNQRPIKFCFQPPEAPPPTEAECPDPCRCMTEEEASRYKLTWCQGTQTPCAWDARENPTKFCFQPPEAPRYESCPGTCTCMTYARAEAGGYELCEQQKIQCGADEYCFFKPLKTYVVPIQKCPQGCACMTPEQAEERGYREWCLRDGDEIPCGNSQYCFRERLR